MMEAMTAPHVHKHPEDFWHDQPAFGLPRDVLRDCWRATESRPKGMTKYEAFLWLVEAEVQRRQYVPGTYPIAVSYHRLLWHAERMCKMLHQSVQFLDSENYDTTSAKEALGEYVQVFHGNE